MGAVRRETRPVRLSKRTREEKAGRDIERLEKAGESLMRLGDTENAIAVFSIALRLRMEESDAVT